MKTEKFIGLTAKKKECLIAALLYASRITGVVYPYRIDEKTVNNFTVYVDVKNEHELPWIYKFFGAAEQYYLGEYSYFFKDAKVKTK